MFIKFHSGVCGLNDLIDEALIILIVNRNILFLMRGRAFSEFGGWTVNFYKRWLRSVDGNRTIFHKFTMVS